jgi:pyruvate carboxylase subunit B
VKYITTVNNQTYEIEINRDGEIFVDGERREVDFTPGTHTIFSALIDNHSYEAVVESREGLYQVLIVGDLYEVKVTDEREQRLAAAAGFMATDEDVVTSPMPGLVVAVPVKAGEAVLAGQTVAVLESMKMENELKAPHDGIVTEVHVEPGQSVDGRVPLVTVEKPEGGD